MPTQKIYKNLDGRKNQLINWSGEQLAADPTGGDLYLGRIWYNSTSEHYKYYDGTAVQTLVTQEDLTAIGAFQGVFDASAGVPSVVLDGSAIVPGDYWRVSVAGTIAGMGAGADALEVGDLVFANVAAASAAGDFSGVQTNLDLPTNIAQVEEITVTLVANTAFDIMTPSAFTEVYNVQAFDSANEEIGLHFAGAVTAVTVEASEALVGVKVRITGK